MSESTRALPQRNEENSRFWDSCSEHAMELQKCDSCGRFWYYPSPICPHCGSLEFTWAPVSGRGVVHSFTWVHRAAPGFEDLVPYAYALVELEEGPVMATNIVGVGEPGLKIGLPVAVSYLDLNDEVTLPLFEPVS
ncbi:MAG: Zn-ribbon domain-containing OB-fold protein [Solirubrobacterales bacterium]